MNDIRLLVEKRATKQGIIERLGWLLSGLREGDKILFHFSGHGVQLPSRNSQGEVDRLDEAICPYDFDWTDERTIRDKEFNQIFSSIPDGVNFTWISDSCHSGDLERKIEKSNKKNKTIYPPLDINWQLKTANKNKIEPLGFVKIAQRLNLVLISGCKSHQTSADAVFDNRFNGALSYFLLLHLNKNSGFTNSLTKIVKDVNLSLKNEGYDQEPQLEGIESIKNNPFLK